MQPVTSNLSNYSTAFLYSETCNIPPSQGLFSPGGSFEDVPKFHKKNKHQGSQGMVHLVSTQVSWLKRELFPVARIYQTLS